MHHFRNLKLKPERDADQPPLMTIDIEVEERKSHLDFPEGDLGRGDMGSNTKIRRPVAIDGEMKRRILHQEKFLMNSIISSTNERMPIVSRLIQGGCCEIIKQIILNKQ